MNNGILLIYVLGVIITFALIFIRFKKEEDKKEPYDILLGLWGSLAWPVVVPFALVVGSLWYIVNILVNILLHHVNKDKE